MAGNGLFRAELGLFADMADLTALVDAVAFKRLNVWPVRCWALALSWA
jgi:hypothetical protein